MELGKNKPQLNKKNVLFVVLGMHRSGTSLITRSIQVFGVDLGKDLLPPQEDNIKGFWEDIDINNLNMEMMNYVDQDWYSLLPIHHEQINALVESKFFSKATEILGRKIEKTDFFGIKDPRLIKLLPFWKKIFHKLDLKVNYLICNRHPFSVSQSLEKRNQIPIEMGNWLWLSYMIDCLEQMTNTGENFIVVDYDLFLASPRSEIQRIADHFQMQVLQSELDYFLINFLDINLRHNFARKEETNTNLQSIDLISEIYVFLLEAAKWKMKLDDPHIFSKVLEWQKEFSKMNSLLSLLDKQYRELNLKNMEINRLMHDNNELNSHLNDILSSETWKVVIFMDRIRKKLHL